jgi:predicted PurR-regulated permease PerM
VNNHILLMVIFSFLVSLVFTFLAKHGARERIKYFLLLFGSFVFFSILVAWLMYPFPF